MSSIHAEPPPPLVAEPTGINYATGSALGKGGFAICHKAERYDGSKPTGHVVALKIVKSKMEPAKLAQKFVTELQIHSKLTHPNIVTFYRAFSFQTSTYVVLEICPNGSLADMLKKRKHLTLPEIRRYMIQICGAVKYLHHRHIVHRDLKTGNLFLDKDMNIKVGDFGLAALLVTEKEMEVKRRTTMCGTPNYLAPEILEKGKGHDEKVDLWAIGVIAYTLAVGKAPFHASTKEEIYKKLKSGTYAWPELSAKMNQSSDLRHLVSSLLVPEEQRPIPDQIVSQNFFKIAFVPSTIPSFAREKAPQWKDLAPPSPTTMKRGYSDTWYEICKESGVGEYEEGRCFKLNGGKRVRSIVHDMAQEAQLGRQPTMPIPKDVVYVSTVSSWDQPPTNVPTGFGLAFPNENHCLSDRAFKEIAPNSVGNPNVQMTSAPSTDAELMPPPPPPSRLGRTGSIRKVARTISEETAKVEKAVKIPSDEPEAAVRVPKARQVAPSTNTIKRSADASLARRPPRVPKPKAAAPLATLDDMMKVSPIKSKRRPAQVEIVEILSDPEPEVEKPRSRGSDSLEPAPLSLPAPPKMGTKKLPVPRKTSASITKPTPSDGLSGTDPNLVLEKLSIFRDNLASALSNATKARSLPTDPSAADSLPFISRWVDYSRKHGIGYVLSDGTVGCIINANPKAGTPVTHVIARNGQKWLPKPGKEIENVEDLPLEIFEDKAEKGIVRKVFKGLGSVREGPLKDEAERRRVLGVLWGKFGRYMCTSLDGAEMETAARSDVFVRFYQRIGSVGIWAFSNGCLQVHFPDNTKLVLSNDGTSVSATCLTPEAASYLSANGDLLPHHVSTREVFTDSLTALLNEGGRVRARVVRANALKEKLQFISEVVDQWIVNGGVGRLNEDDEIENSRKLSWHGLVVKGTGRIILGNVTVGRYGGDLPPK